MMTNKEAKIIFEANVVPVFPLHMEYQDWLTAMNIVSEALDKQIPQKPKHISKPDANDNAEVECKCLATQEVAIKTVKQVYCWKCGQLLDWSEEI